MPERGRYFSMGNENFSVGERGAEREMRLQKACGSAELGQVASGSATQGLWLGNKKARSQVVGENRSRLPRRETVGEVRNGERLGSRTTTELTRKYTDLRSGLGEKDEHVAYHVSALDSAMTDKACREAEMYTLRSSSLVRASLDLQFLKNQDLYYQFFY